MSEPKLAVHATYHCTRRSARHPLPILNISEHLTRRKLQTGQEAPFSARLNISLVHNTNLSRHGQLLARCWVHRMDET